MKQFQDLVTLAPWTFIFQICNLLILTAGVKHFLFKPVQQILAKRKEEIEASYTEAEKGRGRRTGNERGIRDTPCQRKGRGGGDREKAPRHAPMRAARSL